MLTFIHHIAMMWGKKQIQKLFRRKKNVTCEIMTQTVCYKIPGMTLMFIMLTWPIGVMVKTMKLYGTSWKVHTSPFHILQQPDLWLQSFLLCKVQSVAQTNKLTNYQPNDITICTPCWRLCKNIQWLPFSHQARWWEPCKYEHMGHLRLPVVFRVMMNY